MSRQNTGRNGFLGRVEALFGKKSQRKSKQTNYRASESLETRQLLAADLTKALDQIAALDGRSGDTAINSYFVSFDAAVTPAAIRTATGATTIEPFAYFPNSYNITFDSAISVQTVADRLVEMNHFSFMSPNFELERTTRAIPDDTYFPSQWHLNNTGQTGGVLGEDLNIVEAWDTRTGRAVVVGIVDDGLDITHPDLLGNLSSAHLDIVGGDTDPTPASNAVHGTGVAGILAAVGNNSQGISGVAPGASLAGIRLLAQSNSSTLATDEFSALTAAGIDISNNSWGPRDTGALTPLPFQVQTALQQGTTLGRSGKGTIYVWAAGNGGSNVTNQGQTGRDYVNYDAYASSRHVIAVAAIGDSGVRSAYSERGASLLVSGYSTPSTFMTTDLALNRGLNADRPSAGAQDPDGETYNGVLLDRDYTQRISGQTSYAAATVSGVIALMLEENPNLTYRDVMDILVHTARRNDPIDNEWRQNGAGLWVNYKYGFGAVDAGAAVAAANPTTYTMIDPQLNSSTGLQQVGLLIPDNSQLGVTQTVVSNSQLSLEHVELLLNANVPNRGHLEVTLISPSGTRAVLAEARKTDPFADYVNWTFTTTRFWDEKSTGTWTVEVKDLINGQTGTLDSFSLRFFGTELPLGFLVSPAAISERGGIATGTLSRPARDLNQVLTVTLSSNDTSEARVPATVRFGVNERIKTFSITAQDDTLLDGTQTVRITASIPGYTTSLNVSVLDQEEVTININPTAISENAGANAATVTVTRSNTDIFPPDNIVAVGDELRTYDRNGILLNTVPVPWPTGVRPPGENVRDVTIMEDGRIAVFNGTFQASLSVYSPATTDWTHFSLDDLSASDLGAGGITTKGNYVFLSDMEDGTGNPFGILRVDVTTGSFVRFGTRSFGNRLFGSSWPESTIYEINPSDGTIMRSYNNPAGGGGSAGLAFDGRNIWFIVEGSDTLYKIDADSGLLLETHTITSSTNSGFGGLAYLNGRLYLLDSFITNEVVVYDPVARSIVRRLFLDDVNSAIYGITLHASGGLAANPARNSLFVSSTFSDRVYEVSATNGVILPNGTGGLRAIDTGEYWDGGLAVLGDKLYVGAYAGADNELRILTLDGVFVDKKPQPLFFGFEALGGDGIPGLVDTSFRYRDTNLGLDGFLYALDSAGTAVGKFDPETLEELDFLTLEAPVRAIAVDATGKFFGADDNGNVIEFRSDGKLIRTVPFGLGVLNDIELNISGRVLLSNLVGDVAETTTALTNPTTYPTTPLAPAFVTFGEHVLKRTAEVLVTLVNADPTEVSVPVTVIIPVGVQSVTFPLDAVDDNLRDGVQLVNVTATASGYESSSDSIGVLDVEGVTVEVMASQIFESDGNNATQVKVSRTDVDGPFTTAAIQSFSNSQSFDLLDNGVTRSPIVVPSQVSWVTDVDVTVNFEHQWIGDLDVYLVSPKGTRVALFTDLVSNERRMTGTTLDDQANNSILDATAPFTGRFMPLESFLKVYHESTKGTWYLEVVDDNVSDLGKLLNWSMTLYTEGLSQATVEVQTDKVDEAGFRSLSTKTVIIPVNQTEVMVDLDAVDDTLLDGPQNVTIRATSVDVADFSLGRDTVTVLDRETLLFTVSKTIVSEAAGAGAIVGTLTRMNSNIGQPYTVNLTSSDTTELTVPGSVIIPGGQSSVTFQINAVDDFDIDGNQSVTITASAPAYGPDLTAAITVEDLEPSLVLATNTPVVREDSSSLDVTVTRLDQADLSVPKTVFLSVANVPAGGNPTLVVPAFVTIPADAASVTFAVTVLDDFLLDGTQVARITASGASIISGTILISVTDYETLSVTVDKSEFLENAGAKAAKGTVRRSNTNTSVTLVVNLSSSDSTELTVPASVTIPAGSASVEFDITAVNDPALDGPQTVQISASAIGYFGGSGGVVVLDHEPPVMTGPTSTTTNPTPTISWQAIPQALRYELWLSNLSTSVNQLIYKTDISGTSFTPVEKLGIGRYRVWVRAVDNLERPGFWSLPKDFKIETAPTITSPSITGTQASSAFPEIAWTAVADAVRYELWVNNFTTNQVRVISRTNLTTSSYRATEALGSGTYRAFVRAFNASGEVGRWSDGLTFTVLSAPAVIQPAAGGTFDRTPTFTWTPIPGAANYDVWVLSRTTNRVVIRNQNVRATSLTAPTDLAHGDYTVWVRAQAGPYFSNWSAPRLFSIGVPPKITSPANNGTTGSRPAFNWSSITDTERYELWVTNLGTKVRVIYETNLTTTNFTARTDLAKGNYRVWVRAVSTMGEITDWSNGVDFTVVSTNPPAGANPQSDDGPLLAGLLSGSFDSLRVAVPASARVASTKYETMPVDDNGASIGSAERRAFIAIEKFVMPTVDRAADAEAFDAVMAGWDASEWWIAGEPDSTGIVQAAEAGHVRGTRSQQAGRQHRGA